MRIKFLIVIIVIIEIFFIPCYGKNGQNYYIDAQNGNDQADGRNMRSARV